MRTLFDKDAGGCEQDTVLMSIWKFWEGKMSLELPSGFQEMEEERQKAYYPSEHRPEFILEDLEEDTQMTLQFLDEKMSTEDTYEITQKMSELIEEALPKYQQSPVYLFSGNLPMGWFLMHMDDREMEHVKIAFSLEGKMVLLTITYPQEKQAKWRVLIQFIMKSVMEDTD